MKRIRFWLAWARWAVAWLRWAWEGPYRIGDPILGTGWLREHNRTILRQRWRAKEPAEPQRADFG